LAGLSDERPAWISASEAETIWMSRIAMNIPNTMQTNATITLSRVLSTRWMFVISAGGFTLMSLMCATSSTIGEMRTGR
jgi:DHA2 family multidrug resistance protein